MEITLNSSLFLYVAFITYIITGLSAAAIKWKHVCIPYREDPEYYFPNRKRWVFTFCMCLLMIGCIIKPSNTENLIAARCFPVLYTTNFIVAGLIKHTTQKVEKRITLSCVLPISVAIILVVIGWLDLGILKKYENAVLAITGIIALIFTIGSLHTLFWMREQTKLYFENKYSNEDKFPTNFAKEIIPRIMVVLPVIWLTFISSNYYVMGAGYFLISLAHIAFLIYTLDMHIKVVPKDKVEHNMPISEYEEMAISLDIEQKQANQPNEKLLNDLKNIMENEKPYLNPDLTIMELAKMLDTNVETLRFNCKNTYGSFIKMVNGYRLAHSKEIHKQHPEYSKQAIAEESGFGSYRSLLRAEKAEEAV